MGAQGSKENHFQRSVSERGHYNLQSIDRERFGSFGKRRGKNKIAKLIQRVFCDQVMIYQDDHFAAEIIVIILRGICVIKIMLKEYLVTRGRERDM